MAVQAGDLVLPGVNVVSEEDRLARAWERRRILDFGSVEGRPSAFRPPSAPPPPPPPLINAVASMANR